MGFTAADNGEPVIDVVGGDGVVRVAAIGPQVESGASGSVIDRKWAVATWARVTVRFVARESSTDIAQ